MKKKRSSLTFALIFAAIMGLTHTSFAALFYVTNTTQFQDALNTAETNSQGDAIVVAAGTYNIITTLTYDPSGAENYPLTIIGADAASTILEGGDANEIMYIRTRDLSSDSSAHITIANLTFQNGRMGDDSGGGLSVSAKSFSVPINGNAAAPIPSPLRAIRLLSIFFLSSLSIYFN